MCVCLLAHTGTILTAFIVCYALTSFVSGYISGSMYAKSDGKYWIRTMMLTAGLFPGKRALHGICVCVCVCHIVLLLHCSLCTAGSFQVSVKDTKLDCVCMCVRVEWVSGECHVCST